MGHTDDLVAFTKCDFKYMNSILWSQNKQKGVSSVLFDVVWCIPSLHNIIINTKTPGCGLLLSYLCKACQLPPLLLYHPSQSSHQPKTMKTMKESLYKVNTLLMRVVSSRYLFLLFLLFKFFLLPLREFPLEAAVFLSRLNMRSVFIDCKVGIETHITNTIQCWLINR